MDARTLSWIDQYNAHITQTIRRHGLFIQYVGGESCSRPGCHPIGDEQTFAYTVGLFGLGHPELLIFGVTPEEAVNTFLELGDRVLDGEHLIPGQSLELGSSLYIVEEVPNPGDVIFRANDFYQRPHQFSVPVLQLTYADAAGRFPWEDGCEVAGRQPRPGAFKA
ncbi:MAG TPA: DUF4262 domain-containing protein [Acidimicrobiia bacterium]|nr:DUF4262 domain-containing protein [Acidimicrobiia bacterium]